MDKTQRQLQVVSKWIGNNYIGGLLGVTGFGKTYTAMLAIHKVKPKSIIIVVPTLILKDQWTLELSKNNIIGAQVIVINTASRNNYSCDLLIIDEAHTSLADTFKQIFECIKYEKLFWLTATVERTDGRHDQLLALAPIIDTITLEECLLNQWISPYQVYNLAVPFNSKEESLYRKADLTFKYYAMLLGGNAFDIAKNWLKNGTKEQKGQAAGYYNSMRKRKQIITDNSNKSKITVDIVNKFKNQYGIIFSESISFADKVANELVGYCVAIHSKMSKKRQQESLELFNNNDNSINWLSTVKTMNAGIDIPKLEIGIAASFNSSKLISTQILGRLLRLNGSKQAKIINLYTPNSQEKNWLIKKQEGVSNIKWITNVDEII